MKPLSWKTLEFEKKDKSPDWVWTVGLVSVLSSVVSFFYGNIFFGIFLIIAGVVTIIYALKHPKELSITISELGISINEELIEYKNITSFWLDETGKEVKLLLLVKTSFMPTLSLPLEGVSASQVREAIAPYAKEEELRESRSVALFDRIGF
ncbi:MAG: hypothetical protein QG674_116 [Patescibacteria group bacterium]|jgi:hypothetical protein|nr:hypothetical protein [Patescibacteria group bacterium]